MKTDLPDVLVLGDSHSIALADGCRALGMRVESLYLSGNLWHAGRVALHAQHGFWVQGMPAAQKQILALRERLGGRSLLSRDVPVLASFGFHLGRVVPLFSLHGHMAEPKDFEANSNALYASQSLVDGYVTAFRGQHLRVARRMGRLAPTTFVLPPHYSTWGNLRHFALRIAARLQAQGLRVYDPALAFDPSGAPLEQKWLTSAGNHGNAEYGQAVVGHMLDKGLINRRP
ncbi:hypothetical protein [Neogemmobacter tilapiae]|uniref:Uncharacterized protein n=1 Tax=Neogemmobacter tilapiae TaxID=875041 RepID=A0A918THC6_9RHOB|nr:hypothetical protein [Gemmobacter tilapiae]GHC48491.1 hypothetical protein GCM10007315_08130 [Gemmobacter tilapiae]